jgi:hypothetical protein
MKRIGLIALLAVVLAAGVYAQDLTMLGQDFENLITELGAEVLPNLEQSAAWGAYPGLAIMPDDTGFFMTLTLGTLLGDGVFRFAEPDNPAFDVLDVGSLIETILTAAGSATATNLYNGARGFFPYPVTRTTIGYQLPAGVEMMVDLAIFPQFLANLATRIANNAGASIGDVTLHALHVGSLVRVPVLHDAGPLPAVSIGAGYSYGGMALGYDLTSIGAVPTSLGDLFVTGEMEVSSSVHTIELDIQVSKSLGFFVPFIGIAPHFHIADFSGYVGETEAEFSAGIDYDGGGIDTTYLGTRPNVSGVDNDLSILLHGGFDLSFAKFALEFHASWTVGKGSPGVVLGMRWQ